MPEDNDNPTYILGKSLQVSHSMVQKLRAELTKDYADRDWDDRDPDTIKKVIETERHILNAIYTIAEVAVDYDRDEREFGFGEFFTEQDD